MLGKDALRMFRELSQSEAGRALAPLGFEPTHQGGGLWNFERHMPSTAGTMREIVCSALDGQAPVSLLEPVEVYRYNAGESPERPAETRPSLADWLAP